MKEKKIDVLLAVTTFFQLCVLGISGALYTELIAPDVRWWLVKTLVVGDILFVIFISALLIRIEKQLKKWKKKS
ncbi:MAG TPA: hypothetical protein VFE50_17965 [Cyclobacteriaceae bacterium]|nr:hypothetical protein [Cyclobacteriaceae bacterium]